MKTFKLTLLLLVSFLTLTSNVSAQRGEIPNGDFQIWDSVPCLGYEDPRNWVSFNFISAGLFGVITCEHGEISGTNDLYMKLVSDSVSGLDVSPGIIFCGSMDTAGNVLGFPYGKRPDALVGKWQYMAQGDDHGSIGAYFTKWNPTANKRDSIGAAFLELQGMVMNWETFSIPVHYLSTEIPDTCIIIASSSGDKPLQYSYLLLNDLDFDMGSGIHEYAQQHFKVFPNPASDKIQLDLTALTDIQSIELIDIHGKKVRVKSIELGTTSIDVGGLSKGAYFIRVRTKTTMVTERFNKL